MSKELEGLKLTWEVLNNGNLMNKNNAEIQLMRYAVRESINKLDQINNASLSKAEEAYKNLIDDEYWSIACDKYPFSGYDDIEDTPIDKHYRQIAIDYAEKMKQKDIQTINQTLQRYKGLEKENTKLKEQVKTLNDTVNELINEVFIQHEE